MLIGSMLLLYFGTGGLEVDGLTVAEPPLPL